MCTLYCISRLPAYLVSVRAGCMLTAMCSDTTCTDAFEIKTTSLHSLRHTGEDRKMNLWYSVIFIRHNILDWKLYVFSACVCALCLCVCARVCILRLVPCMEIKVRLWVVETKAGSHSHLSLFNLMSCYISEAKMNAVNRLWHSH